jgi:hypothetical protein
VEIADNESGECDSEGGTPLWARPLLQSPPPVTDSRRVPGEGGEGDEVRYIGGCEAAEFAAMAAEGMLLDLDDTDPEAFETEAERHGHRCTDPRTDHSYSSASFERDEGSDSRAAIPGQDWWWGRRDRSYTMVREVHTPITVATEQLVQRFGSETSKCYMSIAAVMLLHSIIHHL